MVYNQYSGKVVNENNEIIHNFRYRGYHNASDTWSQWYSNDTIGFYNINTGDGYWLTQNGIVNVGDIILLMFETLEEDIYLRRCGLIEMPVTSDKVIIQDIMLKTIQPPVVKDKWCLVSTEFDTTLYEDNTNNVVYKCRKNEIVSVDNVFTDEHKWVYNGRYIRQVVTYLNQDIFKDRLGLTGVWYVWEDGVYSETDKHIFTSISNNDIGYVPVTARVRNSAGLITEDTIYAKVYNNKPVIGVDISPEQPSIKDLTQYSYIVNDPDSCLVLTEHSNKDIFLSSSKLSYTMNTVLSFVYKPTIEIKIRVVWDNGFNIEEYSFIKQINMTNIPHTFNVVKIDSPIVDNIRIAINDLKDHDKTIFIPTYKYKLHVISPIDGSMVNIFETPFIKDDSIDIPLIAIGDYVAEVIVKDDYGLEVEGDLLFGVTQEETLPQSQYVEWE